MSINPKHRTQPQPIATTAPQVQPVAVPSPVIDRPRSETNGYLDPDQTLINFAVRELGYSFERIIREDPNRLLRSWGKVYQKAKTTAIGTATMGAAAVLLGVLTGATPLMVVGVLVGGASGLLVKKHAAGVESCNIEHEVLDDCRPVLAFLAELERRGVNPSDLVSLYDRVIRQVSVNPGRYTSASILQKLFKDEVEQSGVLAQVSGVKTGIGAVAPANIPDDRPVALPESQTVGMNTRIGAIAVSADESTSQKARLLQQMREHAMQAEIAAPAVPISSPKPVSVATAWDSVLSDPMRSRAFFGGQRTGKSYFAAAVSSQIKRQKNTRIFHLNLHSFGDEDGYYWKHAEQSIAVDLSAMDFQQAKVVVQSAIKLVETFYKTPNSILIFDEITIVGATNSRYKDLVAPLLGFLADKITILTSSGKKREQAIWTLAPEMVAANLTQPAKAIKSLSLFYISVAPGRSVDWQGQAIGASLELWSQLNVNYTVAPLPFAGEFECDRIACIDAEWVPLGAVPKLEPDSHKLERLMKAEAEDVPQEEQLNSAEAIEKPDLTDKEIMELAVELEEWISAHSDVERGKWWANWNAHRRGLTRPQFRYLLTLIED
jgi:hypothetical protein